MSAIVVIGGTERVLNFKSLPRQLVTAPRVSVDPATLRQAHVIGGFPTDYDQGNLGSCGPNSVAENYEYILGDKFSRLFLYYFTRATEGDADDDDGVMISDLLDVAHTMGMPHEIVCPYDVTRFREPPELPALAEAQLYRVERNDIIADLEHLLVELDRGGPKGDGQPVLLGFSVPQSMADGGGGTTATTGLVNISSDADPEVGQHCVNAIGFDRVRQLVQCTCHYGGDYGDHGTIWLPFGMWKAGKVSDMRAIRSVTNLPPTGVYS